MRHQSLMQRWPLIGFPPLPLNPLLVQIFGPLNIHIFCVAPSKNVVWYMFYGKFMLCIFSVSTPESPFLFVSGNSSLHRCRKMKTYQSVTCDKMTKYAIFEGICTICKNIHSCPRELKSLISSSSFAGNLRR